MWWRICGVELTVAWRARRVVASMLLLSALTVVAFAFSGRAGSGTLRIPALWVSMVLAAALGAGLQADRRRRTAIDEALRLGASSAAVYIGQTLAFGVQLFSAGVVSALLIVLLLDAPWLSGRVAGDLALGPAPLALLLALAALGLSAVATALAQAGRKAAWGLTRIMTLLILPLAAPLLLAASAAAASLESGAGALAGFGWSSGLLAGSALALLILGGTISR